VAGILRLHAVALLGAIWVVILIGIFIARQLPEPLALSVSSAAIHLPYLAYPLLVATALSTGVRNLLAYLAAAAFLAFIPVVASVTSSVGSPPRWYGPACVVFFAGWLYVLWHGARTLARRDQTGGRRTFPLFLLFFFLPWGGVVPLHKRLQAVVAGLPAA
jgi:putative effector of murein hydrolase LrgA (UPF0299 family)